MFYWLYEVTPWKSSAGSMKRHYENGLLTQQSQNSTGNQLRIGSPLWRNVVRQDCKQGSPLWHIRENYYMTHVMIGYYNNYGAYGNAHKYVDKTSSQDA